MAEQINQLGAILGLLQQGFTPEQARAQVDEARAMQFAQLSPSQQRTMMGFQAGQGLGRGVSSLFGVQQEDPTVRMATQLRATLSEQDMETSEGVLKAYRAVKDINPGVAEGLLKRYGELRKQEADIEATKALTEQRRREKQAADPKEQFARANAKLYTPESIDKFLETGKYSNLVVANPEVADKTQTVTAGGRVLLINKQTGETVKDLGAAGKTLEESLGAGLGELGRNLKEGLKKESGAEGEFAAKDYNTLGSAVAAGISSKRNLDVLNNALKTSFTGSLADTKTAFTKFFDAVGAPVPAELKTAASNTELIGAMGTRYVFPLVKNFPGSLAAKELDRLEKTAPNALQQPETIRRLMDLLKVDLAENEFAYKQAKAYKDKNKGSVIGFNQADSRIEFQNKLTTLRNKVNAVKAKKSMTAAEKAEIEALKTELGVE